ncbi:MAG: sulfoxide reductase heme-binding subunit YedZ [Chloroflexi bacterium]|nr:sulfoxide reductase heme-binding subunit YedZ [Chloroflexota bacterium]
MPDRRTVWLQLAVHVAALLPLAVLAWDFARGQLTANPIQEVQLRTGRYALVLLVLSLACTPVYILSGLKQALLLRRQLGLYAFMYASLHFLNFIGLDYGFVFSLIREDISEKRYALVGFATFIILLVLAVTSTRGWMKRLGRNWKHLHRSVYLAALLAVLHFVWLVKVDRRGPLLYGALVVLLLVIRIPVIREAIKKRLKWLKRRQDNGSTTDDI